VYSYLLYSPFRLGLAELINILCLVCAKFCMRVFWCMRSVGVSQRIVNQVQNTLPRCNVYVYFSHCDRSTAFMA